LAFHPKDENSFSDLHNILPKKRFFSLITEYKTINKTMKKIYVKNRKVYESNYLNSTFATSLI